MLNTACFLGPSFSLTGDLFFPNNNVRFQIVFDNELDKAKVFGCEWHLNDSLLLREYGIEFSGIIDCGEHTIGVRILSEEGWSGFKYVKFATCKIPTRRFLLGPDRVLEDQHITYNVFQGFTDGTAVDVSGEYVFLTTQVRPFQGNKLHVEHYPKTYVDTLMRITVLKELGGTAGFTKLVDVENIDLGPGILIVDFYNDLHLDVIAFIKRTAINGYPPPVYTGNNGVVDGSTANNAIILASDLNISSDNNWRFEFNIAKIMVETYLGFPDEFDLCIRGRSENDSVINGSFEFKNSFSKMIMNGSPGTFMPSVIGGDDISAKTNFSSQAAGGQDNTYEMNDLNTLIRFRFNRITETLTPFVPVPFQFEDFDFMVISYRWFADAGSDLLMYIGYERNGTIVDGRYVGLGQDFTIPAAKIPLSDALLWFTPSNPLSPASVINIKEFKAEFAESPAVIEVGLYAYWNGTRSSGDFRVEIKTYKGGTMDNNFEEFYNVGGIQISAVSAEVSTFYQSQLYDQSAAYKVGVLRFNKNTNTAKIHLNY